MFILATHAHVLLLAGTISFNCLSKLNYKQHSDSDPDSSSLDILN